MHKPFHFQRFFNSPSFGNILSNTLLLSIENLIFSLPLPILLALALNECKSKAVSKTVQMVTYAPYFLSTVIMVSLLMQWFSVNGGLFNNILALFGKEPVNLFSDAAYFRPTYIISNIWQFTGFNKDEYKAGLKYMAQMYKDGLINPESWSSNSEQIKNLTAQNTVGCVSGGHLLGCADLSSDIAQNCETVPPLKGPDGVQTCGYYGNTVVSGTRAIITSACEYPEEAFKLIDFMFSEDASLRARKGEYGVDWGLAEEGEKTCDGREAKYKALSEYTGAGNVEQNQHIDNNGVWAETNDQFMGLWTTPENFDMRDSNYFEQFLFVQTKKYDGFEPEQTLPPIVFTDEENAEVADIEVDVKKYADEQRALFISGQKDIDAEWDAYVQQLENLGLSKMVELYDKAYKRQYVK